MADANLALSRFTNCRASTHLLLEVVRIDIPQPDQANWPVDIGTTSDLGTQQFPASGPWTKAFFLSGTSVTHAKLQTMAKYLAADRVSLRTCRYQ
jgi:hypothetical protein